MLDTGNKTGRTLMSEELYRRINPTGEVRSAKMTINTAAKDSQLEVVGVPRDPIDITFFNPELPKQHTVTYTVKPIIIRGLQFPVLLSGRDMKQLGGNIDLKEDVFTLRTKSGASHYPLVGAPRKPSAVHLCETVTVPPGHATHVPVTVIGGTEDEEVQVEPDIRIIINKCILMAPTIDRLNHQKQMAIRVWNATNYPVTLKNNTQLGEAQSLSTVKQIPKDFVSEVNALSTNSELQKARSLSPWPDVKTRQQLYQRLEEDLGFNKPDHSFTKEQRKEIIKVFAKHREGLALNYDEVGHIKGVKFRIPTGDAAPIRSKCRPLPPHLHQALKEQIERWLAQKVIRAGDGPWAAPLVPTPKKNGGWRFAVDYRGLNAITQRDSRPVANLEDQLSKVRSTPMKKLKYFGSLDLSEAYHCLDVAEEDIPKTAMISPLGLHYFNKMAFGMKSAPQAFHAIVQMIEEGMTSKDPELAKNILLYFDDALIAAETFEELIAKLTLFMETIQKIGLKVQPRKCLFCVQKVKWLGHIITEQGIQPDPDRIQPLLTWSRPQTLEEVRSLHGLLGTMRKFIKNFACKTKNIRKHLKPMDSNKKNKRQPVQWDKASQDELDALIKILTSAPILAHPDFSPTAKPFIITVDTSSTGIGGTLSQVQKQPNGEELERIIAYCSRKLRDGERGYSAYKLELCGLVTILEHFRLFLIGKPFIVRTDHKALTWLMKPKHETVLPALVWRWQQWLNDYQFEIEWVGAQKLRLADSLSRKRYEQGDQGNMETPMPKRDPLWKEDAALADAQDPDNDDFWIDLMKKKFHRTEDGKEDVGVETDAEVEECMHVLETYACTADIADAPDSDSEEEVEPHLISNYNTSNFLETTECFTMTRQQRREQAQQKNDNADHQLTPLPSGIPETIDPATEDDLPIEDVTGNDEGEANDPPTPTDFDEESIRQQFKEGKFHYDEPTHDEIQQSISKTTHSGNPNEFKGFIRNQQKIDRGLKFVAECVLQQQRWPENDLEIKKTLKRLYTMIWIGRIDDDTAGPIPPLPEEEHERTPEQTDLQRKGDPIEQRKMRARMHDRQEMFSQLCKKHQQGESVDLQDGILTLDSRIIVPVGMGLQQKIIKAIHHSQGSFHLGQNKTVTIIQRYFWFPRCRPQVQKYLSACKQCVDGKRLHIYRGPDLGQTSSYSRERLRTWAMDTIQMPPGNRGNGYIITCLDLATSWLEAFAVKRATGENIANIITYDLVPRYGEGLTFIVDQGKEFLAKIVQQAVKNSVSKIHYGTIYHSQSNPVERFHRTLEGVIRCLLIDRKKNAKHWPSVLNDALRTMRSAPDATGFSPFYRVFGLRPRISAIEWMNLGDSTEEGGFKFDPHEAPRTLEVSPTEVYPTPTSTGEHAIEDSEIIYNDGTHLQVRYRGEDRLLTRIGDATKRDLFRQVCTVTLPQEAAQAAKDELARKTHANNADRIQRKRPKNWCPIMNELVDWKEPVDPDNPTTRKMRNPYQGPYLIIKRDLPGKTVTIQKVSLDTLEVQGKKRTVHVGQIRPTMEFEWLTRPRGDDWTPNALWTSEDNAIYTVAGLTE